MTLTPTARALAAALISAMEGLRLAAYKDGGGTWTIAVGSTFMPSGRRVQGGDTISHAAALELLEDQIEEWATVIARTITVPLSDFWWAVLASFIHQEGVNALPGSVLADMLNAKLWARAGGQLNGWVIATAGGVRGPQLGIMRRMEAQRRMAVLSLDVEPTRTQVWALGDGPLLPLYKTACDDAASYRGGHVTWEVHPVAAAPLHAAPVPQPSVQQSPADTTDALNDAQLASIQGATT